MEDPELELEQPELRRSADLRFADPEEAPTWPGPPGKPSVPLTIRHNRTMKSRLSIERVQRWARRIAWHFALRKALRRWRDFGTVVDAAGAAVAGGGAATAFPAPAAAAGEGGCGLEE